MIAFEESKLNTDWKNGWNVTTARLACETALQTSAVYEQYNSLDAVDNDISIESCVRDVQITGKTDFLHDVKERMKTECVSEIRFNASLWENRTSSGESLVDSVLDNDCPNDCSSAGICTKGICVCNISYTGEDCSVCLLSAPTLYGINKDSLCDLSKRACDSISLFGEGFYPSRNITCRIEEADFIGTVITGTGKHNYQKGNLESFGEVVCPTITSFRRKRSLELFTNPYALLINVSMDGMTYSTSIPVIMYDSDCTNCTLAEDIITCAEKTDICVVDGKCYYISSIECKIQDDETSPQVTTTTKMTTSATSRTSFTTTKLPTRDATSTLTTGAKQTTTSSMAEMASSPTQPEQTRSSTSDPSTTTIKMTTKTSTTKTTTNLMTIMSSTTSNSKPLVTSTLSPTIQPPEAQQTTDNLAVVIGLPITVLIIFVLVFTVSIKIHCQRK